MNTRAYVGSTARTRVIVLEQGRTSEISLGARNQWSMGRKTDANNPDIPLTSPIAGREHGVLVCMSGNWYYMDKGSANGTYLNGVRVDNRYKETSQLQKLQSGDLMEIDGGDIFHPDERRVWLLFSAGTGEPEWLRYPFAETPLNIGGAGCGGLELPFLQEGAACAQIVSGGQVCSLRVCSGQKGILVNGSAVNSEIRLADRDIIVIDGQPLLFAGDALYYRSQEARTVNQLSPVSNPPDRAEKGGFLLEVDIHTKQVPVGNGLRELLHDVRLQVPGGSLVAVLGTSGAGKSTLMNCMNGMDTKGVEGSVCFDGIDLLKNYEQVKYRIGSVPQGNVINPVLTVRKELEFAAKKYLPADTSRQEQEQRVNDTLRKLRLEAVQDNRIGKCSGGEQKRVNIGVELVLDRQMLCLDEPDAGLDPQMKTELFEILRELSHTEHKMIFVIIHDVSDITLFDQVILLTKVNGVGRLAFSGSPEDAENFFGAAMKEVYGLLSRRPDYYVEQFAGISRHK